MSDDYHIDQNPYKGNKGLTRALRAAVNSWHGLVFAYQEESAFRQELAITCILIPISIFLPVSPIEHVALISSICLVLIIELLNSSIEAAIDRISFEHHGLSKRAKDFGSAAVMLALFLCLITWVYITYPLIQTT